MGLAVAVAEAVGGGVIEAVAEGVTGDEIPRQAVRANISKTAPKMDRIDLRGERQFRSKTKILLNCV
jgi:hypothetical protein